MTGIPTVKDEPIDNAKLLGLQNIVEILTRFLTSDTLVSPLVIALNGEWGTGKTSLINTLIKRLDENGRITVSFDAWKYEFSDPAAALFYTIAKRLEHGKKVYAKNISKLALDIFARRYTGMSITAVQKHFETGVTSVSTISEKLKTLVKKNNDNKRIVVFIDDLDRCSLENVLEVLDTLKLFLGIRNFIFVIAVDMSKIRLAWSYKFGKIDEFTREGLKYLEKIFQIEKTIPVPTPEQVKEYVKSLIPASPSDIIETISLTGIKNPRDIKRLLNLMSLRANVREEQTMTSLLAVLWTTFETLVGKEEGSKLYSQSGGSKGFYEFLGLKDLNFSFDESKTDEENADHLIEMIANDPEARNKRSYPLLLFNDTDIFGIPLKKRVGLYLMKSQRILSEMEENQAAIIECINDVVSFS
jgi:hypothetical protein